MENIIRGTEIKFILNVEPIDDLHLIDLDFTVRAYCKGSTQEIIIPKDMCVGEDADNFIVPVDTTGLGTGLLLLDVTVFVPDDIFANGLRTEIVRLETEVTIIV